MSTDNKHETAAAAAAAAAAAPVAEEADSPSPEGVARSSGGGTAPASPVLVNPSPVVPLSILRALHGVQKEIQTAGVAKTGNNVHLKSTYVTLPDILDVVMPALTNNGLVMFQFPVPCHEPGKETLMTTLAHAPTGDSMEFSCTMAVGKNDPQGYGSFLTYAAKYSLLRFFMLRTVDDDAEAAMGRGYGGSSGAGRPRQYAAAAAYRTTEDGDSAADADAAASESQPMPPLPPVAGSRFARGGRP